MKYEINFIKYFSDEEKEKISNYIEENFEDLELHSGCNYAVDVSDVIGRTSNVDIDVEF